MSGPDYSQISCRVCSQKGAVRGAKIRRMSGPVVAIGYIFLIPSFIGMLFGVMMLFGSGNAGGSVIDDNKKEYEAKVQEIGLPKDQESQVLALSNPTSDQLTAIGLTQEQGQTVESLQMSRSAGDLGAGAGAAIGMGFSIFLVISSFVGGLIGWILTMKKKVLLCGTCKGVHADAA